MLNRELLFPWLPLTALTAEAALPALTAATAAETTAALLGEDCAPLPWAARRSRRRAQAADVDALVELQVEAPGPVAAQ